MAQIQWSSPCHPRQRQNSPAEAQGRKNETRNCPDRWQEGGCGLEQKDLRLNSSSTIHSLAICMTRTCYLEMKFCHTEMKIPP